MKVIKIQLNHFKDATNCFNDEIISEELEQYILKTCTFTMEKNFAISIVGIPNKEEQKKLEELIHNFYKNKVSHLKQINLFDDIKRILLLILGTLLILLSHLFQYVLSEIFLISGWVAICEMVYDLLFSERKKNRNYLIFKKLSHAKIIFEN